MNYKINLLSEKEKNFLEKINYFVLNYLRYILVITQLVIILVFFYRFQIDQEIIDLRDSVSQKKEIINIVLPLINESKRIKIKIDEISNILNQQNKFKSSFDYVLFSFPYSIKLTEIEIDNNNNFKIIGYSKSSKEIDNFLSSLKKDKKFKIIEIKTLKKLEDNYIFLIYLKDYLI
ncbi:MAG: hypothetical protein N2593_01140 [Patescibacteria group bacterium]|nr:hypothetical protein [Patescibacteria group bacterium]